MNRGASRHYAKLQADSPKTEKPNNTNSNKGAVESKTSFSDRSRSYWAHHRSSLIDSFKRLMSTPIQSLMTALVVAIALALPATLLIVLSNLAQLGHSWDAKPKISVFTHVRARQEAIEQLIDTIEAYPEVEEVVFLSAQEALADFQKFSGFGEALSSLDDNPLPATIIVSPKKVAMVPAQLEIVGKRIQAEAIVEEVSLDMDWVRRLQELIILGERIVMALASLLGLGVLLAIGNTIRLAIENRREEILVTKLVGATNSFVRRPFLYTGGWYGFWGGLLACFIVLLGISTIEPTVLELATLYKSAFTLQGLDGLMALKLITVSTILGWMGAWLAVGRHLTKIEPH